MENWKEFLASFGLWLLVEDISDDGDGEGDNLQLTKDGELFVSEIQQELDKAREEGRREQLKESVETIQEYRDMHEEEEWKTKDIYMTVIDEILLPMKADLEDKSKLTTK